MQEAIMAFLATPWPWVILVALLVLLICIVLLTMVVVLRSVQRLGEQLGLETRDSLAEMRDNLDRRMQVTTHDLHTQFGAPITSSAREMIETTQRLLTSIEQVKTTLRDSGKEDAAYIVRELQRGGEDRETRRKENVERLESIRAMQLEAADKLEAMNTAHKDHAERLEDLRGRHEEDAERLEREVARLLENDALDRERAAKDLSRRLEEGFAAAREQDQTLKTMASRVERLEDDLVERFEKVLVPQHERHLDSMVEHARQVFENFDHIKHLLDKLSEKVGDPSRDYEALTTALADGSAKMEQHYRVLSKLVEGYYEQHKTMNDELRDFAEAVNAMREETSQSRAVMKNITYQSETLMQLLRSAIQKMTKFKVSGF